MLMKKKCNAWYIFSIIRSVYKSEGIPGFYRGMTASYVGALETMMYFVLYEKMKSTLRQRSAMQSDDASPSSQQNSLWQYTVAAFTAKIIATIALYPHEVVRTRLRQEPVDGVKLYTSFVQTLTKVFREERWNGMYGGLGARIIRQVPNTVIMFISYEYIVNFFVKDER